MARNILSAASLKSALAKASASGKVTRISDGEGLLLTVRANGAASWILRATLPDGQRKDITLGRWPAVGLSQARELADRARSQIADGVDPIQERQQARQQARARQQSAGDSVRRLFEQWLSIKTCGNVYRGNIEAAITKDVLPVIGSMPPHEVQRADIIKILRTVEARDSTEMVRRVRMWLRQMFEHGIDDEARPLLQASPVPMGTLASFKAHRPRNFPAITNASEVPGLMRACRATEHWTVRTALLFSAYTFQRPTEIREAVWDEFDLDAARWVIPEERMKMGRGEHRVPLATQVVSLLRQHQGVVGSVGLVFPGRKYGQPLSEGTLLSRIKTAGYAGRHSPHGFRAMARTLIAEELHVPAEVIERQLAHVSGDPLRGAYNRAEWWPERVGMMQRWADWLDGC